ncbi:hypothetical protein H6P81_004220 [Aristolochia fimbriata]|uniref:Small-subunit processome Utp12 domain-containing protein n=1 Tax=Aristolochia fimbriata TaxID=158543 RepID=A0AAV7FET0_ARIFI|nr:hypothetical protein H6P81_004220 [Aristolochia fimbriata]
MGREEREPLVSSFSSNGDYFAISYADGLVKIWHTGSGKLFAEWKNPDQSLSGSYSCISCSVIGKKRKKQQQTFLLALGTHSGDVFAVNVLTANKIWITDGCHPGGVTQLSFANNGGTLYTAGADGMVAELDAATGEPISKFKASKKPIISLSLSFNESLLAVSTDKIRIFNLETKKEIEKFSSDSGRASFIALSDAGKFVVSSREKQLQVWALDKNGEDSNFRTVLSMKKAPVTLACRSYDNEEGLAVVSVSSNGIAYIWNLRTTKEEEVNPTKIMGKHARTDSDKQKDSRKIDVPVIAARFHDVEGALSVLVVYGSSVNPQFDLFEVTSPGSKIFLSAPEKKLVPETVRGSHQENVVTESPKRKVKKKRATPESPKCILNSGNQELNDESNIDHDDDEPTMGEKLASLNLIEDTKCAEDLEAPLDPKPPSADSIHVLLKQALHAEDRALLLDCLVMRDEKVIANSVSSLNPSDVLKLLNSLLALIQSRGAVLARAIPWLRSLLLQHTSGIMSQESSLHALNSFYQLIESRRSTFKTALQLTGCVDFLFTGIGDNVDDEENAIPPVIYEDEDDSEKEGSVDEESEESVDAMETDDDGEELGMNDFRDEDDLSN